MNRPMTIRPSPDAIDGAASMVTTALEEVLECAEVPTPDDKWEAQPVHLAADNAEWIRDYLTDEGTKPVIPHRGCELNHDLGVDRARDRGRNVIERLVGRLKECRRIFSRFEKTAVNYLGRLKMGMLLFYLKVFCPNDI